LVSSMRPLRECQLYTFVDTAYLAGRSVQEVARQLCDGGSDIIQLRAKSSTLKDIWHMAEAIGPIAERAGVHFVVNDHVEIARQLTSPFVHLGQEDFFDAGLRHTNELRSPQPGGADSDGPLLVSYPPLRIGLSSHAPAQAELAIAAGADYLAAGPVFATPTKPGRPPVSLDYVRWAAANVPIPWFAIGGITLENLDTVLAAGARRICVLSSVLQADDVAGACQRFRERLFSATL